MKTAIVFILSGIFLGLTTPPDISHIIPFCVGMLSGILFMVYKN